MTVTEAAAEPARYMILPDAPADLTGPVKAWRQAVPILSYMPGEPTKHPMFLEKRVYQGSSGRVYPLPFIDRIAIEPTVRSWDAIHIENEYIRLMILPELGGRIHIGYDKRSGYDFFYRQNVIKPALVGLAGPWISGGVEFNWPQHHRPATFMPVETDIEQHTDGSVTVWCSDHDPMLRMKGMHGVCLRPGWTTVELKARLYNRTGFTQTFLWWANVATRVHEEYQSFFPSDVRFVADHAKRAVTSFPLSDRPYYGVDYAERAKEGVPKSETPAQFKPDGSYAANDLSWYANIPVPTSYMVTKTADNFFGGYDHAARAGVVHVANHHIAPGKKQWTWGNHEFGYAWDRSLTDHDGPYIELMAGVYTDNQPDFSWLAPWETKTFTQVWYPLKDMGVPQAANAEAALHLDIADGAIHLAVEATHPVSAATIELSADGITIMQWQTSLQTESSFTRSVACPPGISMEDIKVRLLESDEELLVFSPRDVTPAEAPVVATEPLPPSEVSTVEELYLIGLHLHQYRHATRSPHMYWEEALRRDPADSRSLNALGLWHMRRGEFAEARSRFNDAIARLTALNPNPYDGEAFYNLGQCLRFLGETDKAYDAFYKATWTAAWRAPSYFAIAELDCTRGKWNKAKDHVERSLKAEADNISARNLLAYVLKKSGHHGHALSVLNETRALDRLDIGCRWELGEPPSDPQQRIDLVLDLARAGRRDEATGLLQTTDLDTAGGAGPILLLLLADLQETSGDFGRATILDAFDKRPLDYCFPHRLEELLLLQRTCRRHPKLWGAWYLLGNLLYDKGRHREAIECWKRAVEINPSHAVTWRNLGIGYFNVARDVDKSLEAFDRAFKCDRTDGRIVYERDQLRKRVGVPPEERLSEYEGHREIVASRDDLSVEMATLYNQLGRPEDALDLLLSRTFQPWEGGEGLVLGQYVRSHLLLGQAALERGDAAAALQQFQAALDVPRNLSEAKHLLANQSDVYYWLGLAFTSNSHSDLATVWFERAARYTGDFQQMSVKHVSNMTLWSALALRALRREDEAVALFHEILRYSEELEATEPKIDYFATSLPAMLLFEDDLARRNRVEALFLRAQALLGLGLVKDSEGLLHQVLSLDVNHVGALDLLAHRNMLAPHREHA